MGLCINEEIVDFLPICKLAKVALHHRGAFVALDDFKKKYDDAYQLTLFFRIFEFCGYAPCCYTRNSEIDVTQRYLPKRFSPIVISKPNFFGKQHYIEVYKFCPDGFLDLLRSSIFDFGRRGEIAPGVYDFGFLYYDRNKPRIPLYVYLDIDGVGGQKLIEIVYNHLKEFWCPGPALILSVDAPEFRLNSDYHLVNISDLLCFERDSGSTGLIFHKLKDVLGKYFPYSAGAGRPSFKDDIISAYYDLQNEQDRLRDDKKLISRICERVESKRLRKSPESKDLRPTPETVRNVLRRYESEEVEIMPFLGSRYTGDDGKAELEAEIETDTNGERGLKGKIPILRYDGTYGLAVARRALRLGSVQPVCEKFLLETYYLSLCNFKYSKTNINWRT